ncbi:MAG TPA: glycosyltransferase family 4 protein [Chthoniobacteraceae bacterium]|nr:glycosyltransferase family 4 protein [Chthoniobacteraceae bacterium]
MRILFLNQYFPPDSAPTGILLHELGEWLQAQGHEVDYVSSAQDYRNVKKNSRRLLREASALCGMLFKGLKTRRPDVVFSASSPPCLLVVATLIAAWHRAKSVHWLMDMYPELAVALGEVKAGFVSGVTGKLMGWGYRRAKLVVGLDEDMALRLKNYGVEAEIIPPWVLQSFIASAPMAPIEPAPEWTWIYSGNLGRAHEWETLLQAQALVEKRGLPIRLLFQGGGPSWPLAKARAAELGLRQCDWNGYVREAELQASLLRARALVITQKPEAQGLLWPSKLALASTLPRPILWIGPVDGAIARQISALPHAGVFAPGSAEQVADWLQKLHQVGTPRLEGRDAATGRQTLIEKWGRLLAGE